MNDITALAQREKFEAWLEEAEALPWGYLKKRRTSDDAYHEPNTTDMWGAWQAASAELVEALEKAQAITAAAEKLVRCKGRYHSEQNYRALAALFGVNTPDLPPMEGESRTVTLPPRVDSSNVPFTAHTWNCCLDAVEKCLAAAGIQVIEGEGQCGAE